MSKTDPKPKDDTPTGPLPSKWTVVYPYGTTEGDEEAKVFKALARNKKHDWMSTSDIAQKTKLPTARVEEIIDKYVNKVKPPLIYASPTNDDFWGYWERVPEVLKKDRRTVATKDKDARIKRHMSSSPSVIINDLPDIPPGMHPAM